MAVQGKINSEEFDVLDEEIKIQKKISERLKEAKQPLEVVFKWKAPERFFEKKTTRWFVIVSGIALVCVILSALTNNFVLIFAIICLVLVVYSLYTIPPKTIEHQLTNKGIYTLNTLYPWKNMSYFWVSVRSGQYILNIEYRNKTTDNYYQRMLLIVPANEYKYVASYIAEKIDYLGPEHVSKGILTTFTEGSYISLQEIVAKDKK